MLPPHGEAIDTSPWYNIFEPISLGPLSINDIVHLIRHYNRNPDPYAPAAEQAIVAASDGKPFDAQWLCSESVKAMVADQRTMVLLADVEQAVQTHVQARSSEYTALWQQSSRETQYQLGQAQTSGALVGDTLPRDDLERLLDGGYSSPLARAIDWQPCLPTG